MAVADFRAAASVLMSRWQFLRQAGITFGGNRDAYQILGYRRLLTVRDYRDRYARGGVAGRIVDAFPNATWRGEMTLTEDPDAEVTTTFEQAWADLDQRLQIRSKFLRVDKLSRLSTYGVLLIGAPGNLEEELPKGNPEDLLYFQPFIGGGGPGGDMRSVQGALQDADATIFEFDSDAESPRFGQPKSYQLRRTYLNNPTFQRPVHWSRIVHVCENALDDEVYGQPALERVWNLLDDLDKVTGGGAEAFWLRANQGMHLDVDKDLAIQPSKPGEKSELDKLKDQAEDYGNQMTRWLRTRGVTATPLGSDVANFGPPADAILTQIAGSTSMPKRILTGSEMGELASSQDRDNWKDQINGRQTQYAGPVIVRQLVDRLIAYGYLPTPSKGPSVYEVAWPHMQTLTAQEKADGAAKWATVNATMGMTVFTDADIRKEWYGLDPTEESDQELWRASLAEKMAMVNKTQGITVFTDNEIRETCYNWAPLSDAEKVPIGAPERISVTQPPEQAVEPAVLKALEEAIEADDLTRIGEILELEVVDVR